ncbi:albusnodin/ikarugamycin family macrolactam cyclase [Lentzea tibetensis]|nr:albusnodin/ikarugamycin family macrolactam cyclase [Lentzea tibetensis]
MTPTATRRCFVGWAGPDPHPPRTPANSSVVWNGAKPLWTVGDWRPDEVAVVAVPQARAAFLGTCLATDDELRSALHDVMAGQGFDALQALPGSYAVVLDDGHRLHVITDRAGLHPVFHTDLAGSTLFASDALMAASVHHRNLAEAVNPLVVAAWLYLPDLLEPRGQDSVFRRVGRVGAAQVLTMTPYHSPQFRQLPLKQGSRSIGEAAPMLAEALVKAVGWRVDRASQVSTDLSGGLDSSSCAVLAAQAGAAPLAVTYADPRSVNDEDVQFASSVASAEPGLRHLVIIGRIATLPFTDMQSIPICDEPSLDALIIARTRHRLGPALEHRSECHLTGGGGDVVLTAPGLTYLGDLARAGHRSLRHEASGWARLRHHPARHVRKAATRLARTSWTATIRTLADQLVNPHLVATARRGLDSQLAWAVLSPCAAWGTLRMRQALAARLTAAAVVSSSEGVQPDSADGAAWRAVQWHGAATRGFHQVARTWGLVVHSPFLDSQVIDACLAVPAGERTTVDKPKPLLAAALDDRLPPGLLERRTKGDYSTCEYQGLRANADTLRALLAKPLLSELDILIPEGPRDALQVGLAGASAPLGALGSVIATEIWLHALHNLDPTDWWHTPRTREERPR